MYARAYRLSLQVDKGGKEYVVKRHKDSCCPVIGKVVGQEDHHKTIEEHGDSSAKEHTYRESSQMPHVSVPVAEPEE